jgi:hypothetical protein
MTTVMRTAPRNDYEFAVSCIAGVLAAGNLLLGSLLVLGNPQRFAAPSFRTIVSIADPKVWGMVLLVAGCLALVGQIWRLKWPGRVGHSLSSIVCLAWTLTFIEAAVANSASSLTGIAAYLIIGLLHACAAPFAVPPARP